MIYLYNTCFEVVEVVNEVSFSYSKKAGKEGGGKVALLAPPNKDAFYLIIYALNSQTSKDEYITSGYITELIEEKEGCSFQFKTFEGLLKNHALPKNWNIYNNFHIPHIVADLMFGFRPIYKTSKADLGVFNSNNPTYLISENIAFQEIEGADLTLAFDASKKTEENVYYYCQKGFVIFQYDLGTPPFVRLQYAEKKEGEYTAIFPTRILRWSEQVGEKTFVKWKAIEKDEKVNKGDSQQIRSLLNELAEAPTLQARRDLKRNSIEEGVPLPNTKRFLILQLIFEYIKPDYVNDFNTQEINPKVSGKGVKVKRTVRGFTPILHGFEILNRCPLTPFSFHKETTGSYPHTHAVVEVAGALDIYCHKDKVKFAGANFLDALSKMQEAHNFNIAFDLRKGDESNLPLFRISLFNDDAIIDKEKPCCAFHGRDLRFTEKALLRSPDDVPFIANFTLSKMKKKIELPLLLDCKGAGSEIDAIRFVFYINYVLEGNEYKREVFVYGADGLDVGAFNGGSGGLQVKPVSSSFIDSVKTMPYIEETLEVNNAKTPREMADEVLKYLVDKENKQRNETFEAGVFQDVRLYDCVRLLHAKSGKAYDVYIREEKITSKNGKLTKSVGLAGDIYNPFDCFFVKKHDFPIITIPTIPIDIKVTSHKNRLRVEWTALGVYDEFKILVQRIDGMNEIGFENGKIGIRRKRKTTKLSIASVISSKRFFSTTAHNIELTSLSFNTIYSVCVASCYEDADSEYTKEVYFKLEDTDSHIRHLSSLEEEGDDSDEAYFYDFSLIKDEKGNFQSRYEYLSSKISHKLLLFNNIEQIRNRVFTADEIYNELILNKPIDISSAAFYHRSYTRPLPYKNNPPCNKWSEDLYEEVLNYFGKYYVWRCGKWRERRFQTPAEPLFFFDLEPKALSEKQYTIACKGFQKNWEDFYLACKEFQEIREKINKLVAYKRYHLDDVPKGTTIFPGQSSTKHKYKPFSLSERNEKEEIEKEILKEGKSTSLEDASYTPFENDNRPPRPDPTPNPPKDPNLQRPNPGDWETPPINPRPGFGPGDVYTPPGEKDPLPPPPPVYPLATGEEVAELELYKKRLVELFDKIKEIIERQCDDIDSTRILGYCSANWENKKIEGVYLKKKNTLFDVSKNANHLDYKLMGWQMLSDVRASLVVPLAPRTEEKNYFLQHSFLFCYADLDNGGYYDEQTFTVRELDIRDGKVVMESQKVTTKDEKGETALINVEWPRVLKETEYELSFPESFREHPPRPYYQKDVIPFLSNKFTNDDAGSLGMRTFTFSCWLRFYEASDDICLFDISGMCVGYIKDGNLHFAHREVMKKKVKVKVEIDGEIGEGKEREVEVMEYPLSDFYIYKGFKGSPSYIHIMVVCEVEKKIYRTYGGPIIGKPHTYCKCQYKITQDIFINFKQVAIDEYETYKDEEHARSHVFEHDYIKPETDDKQHDEACFNTLSLESLPAFRIAYYEPKVKQQYEFRYAKDKGRYIFTAEYDETDYSWHYYKFELSHVMLFPFLLSNLERLHLREYGIYPIKRPVKQVENTESGESGSSGSGNTSTDDYKPQGYLGVVNEKAEKYSNRIKTLKTGNREVLASSGEFFLMAINCKAFKAGFLYRWDGKEWNELSPFIKYPRECKDAFNDIKELSHLSQAGFYREFASFGVAICSGLFSSTIMTDALSVIGDITLMNLPNYDPHKRGALFRRGSRLYISTG